MASFQFILHFLSSRCRLELFSSFSSSCTSATPYFVIVVDGEPMLLSRHERPSVMDLDLTSVLPANSRKSSLSLIEKASLPDHHTHAHQRRLSASQIIPIVSQSLLLATANGFRRSPLAPLDPQLAAGLNTDIAMADGRDSPTGRKPSCVTPKI